MNATITTSPVNNNSPFAFENEAVILAGKLRRYGMTDARNGGNPRDGYLVYGTDPCTTRLVFFYTHGSVHRWCVARRQQGHVQ